MSPQMRDFVPHMAARYDFDYEFVTYKWPSWLHKQVRVGAQTAMPRLLDLKASQAGSTTIKTAVRCTSARPSAALGPSA